MTTLQHTPFSSQSNDYQGFYVGTPPVEQGEGALPQSDLVRFFSAVKAEHKQTVESGQPFRNNLVVSDTTPAFYLTAVTDAGQFPTGTSITLVRPDGTSVVAGTFIAPWEYATFDSQGNLIAFTATLPDTMPNLSYEGTWSITVVIPDTVTDGHFMACTVPTADTDQTMINTLTPYLDQTQVTAELTGGVPTSCWVCRVGLATLAVIIAAVLALGSAIVVWTFPPVGVLAAWIGGTNFALVAVALNIYVVELAMAIIKTMIALVGATMLAVAGLLCALLGSCAETVGVAISSPPAGQTVQGRVPLGLHIDGDATKVEFYVDGVLNQTVTPPTGITWDTTETANGPYVLTLVAWTSTGTSGISVPVALKVQN